MPISWSSWKKSLACKSQPGEVHDPRKPADSNGFPIFDSRRVPRSGCSKSFANLKDVVHGSRRMVVDNPPTGSPLSVQSTEVFPNCNYGEELESCSNVFKPEDLGSVTPFHAYVNGTPLKRLGSCYNCSLARNPALCSRGPLGTCSSPLLVQPVCKRCGEFFRRYDALEHHHLVKHAVTQLKHGDSSRNIIEIIFKTCWPSREITNVKIERVLKVHNTQRTVTKFEEYRDMVKAKASKLPKKHPRCLADGNELLRFHGTTLLCSLGMNGSSSLCSLPNCNVCCIIRSGFPLKKELGKGIQTTATSGKAHDSIMLGEEGSKRAMLVCRVIAGRIHKAYNRETICPPNGFDSAAGETGLYSKIEELYVFNSKAILPCFVVIYNC
eukprot:c21319_g1_i1 orf=225-1370(+)